MSTEAENQAENQSHEAVDEKLNRSLDSLTEEQEFYDREMKDSIHALADKAKSKNLNFICCVELGKVEEQISETESREGTAIISTARINSESSSSTVKAISLLLNPQLPRELIGRAIAQGKIDIAYMLHRLTEISRNLAKAEKESEKPNGN